MNRVKSALASGVVEKRVLIADAVKYIQSESTFPESGMTVLHSNVLIYWCMLKIASKLLRADRSLLTPIFAFNIPKTFAKTLTISLTPDLVGRGNCSISFHLILCTSIDTMIAHVMSALRCGSTALLICPNLIQMPRSADTLLPTQPLASPG